MVKSGGLLSKGFLVGWLNRNLGPLANRLDLPCHAFVITFMTMTTISVTFSDDFDINFIWAALREKFPNVLSRCQDIRDLFA